MANHSSLTQEERAARSAERTAIKAAKQKANKENWKHHPANANAAWMQRQAELKDAPGPAIPAEPIDDDPAISRSLQRLRRLMLDTNAALHRRLDAAEVVLSYELGPGAAAGADPATIAATSYKFLQAVIDQPGVPEALQFRALKSIAAVENARATAKRAAESAEQFREKRELFRQIVNAERRRCLIEAGAWPPSDPEWCLKPGDDFDLPAGLSDMEWPPQNIGGILDHAQPDTAFRASLLSVRAKNRTDDAWDLFGIFSVSPAAA